MSPLKLTTYLSSHLGIDEEEVSTLVETCTIRRFNKDEFLLRQNEHCRHTFFVEEGLLRQYAINRHGKEHTISFAPENWFVADRESVHLNAASVYNIQALESSKVVMINEHFIAEMSKQFPSFIAFNNKLLHNHIRQLQNRIIMLLSYSAEERYLQFIEMYPDILLRVPQTMVASYLGMTPESLSRVRKALAQKHFKK